MTKNLKNLHEGCVMKQTVVTQRTMLQLRVTVIKIRFAYPLKDYEDTDESTEEDEVISRTVRQDEGSTKSISPVARAKKEGKVFQVAVVHLAIKDLPNDITIALFVSVQNGVQVFLHINWLVVKIHLLLLRSVQMVEGIRDL